MNYDPEQFPPVDQDERDEEDEEAEREGRRP